MNDLKLLEVYNFKRKIRLGSDKDGGYVIAELDSDYDCYISAGISDEESFSRDFINKYSMNEYNSFGFDGTINKYPYNFTKNISFINKNINNFNDDNNSDLSYLIENYYDIFLKMDIEGSEYEWLNALNESQLNKFKQIVIEFHGINDDSWNTILSDKIKCFEKLSNTHYPVHIHGNNNGTLTGKIPDTVEITYIRKNEMICELEFNQQLLPIINLDFPNNPNKKDYDLNFPPFVN